jgi:hypothetical protein
MSKKTNPKKSDVSADKLEEAQSLLGQVTGIVGKSPALTGKERIRSVKLRKGGETVIPTVAALSAQFGLTVASHPTDAMVASAKKAQSLIALHKQLVAATKNVSDQMFTANSESWAAATVHYSMLRRLARTDGDLATALAPVTKFFSSRSATVVQAEDAKTGHRRGVKAPKGSKTTKTATTAAATEGTTSASAPAAPSVTAPTHAAPVTPAPISAPTP